MESLILSNTHQQQLLFKFCQITFSIQFLDKGFLPPFKGSMIRGALGNALRRTVCMGQCRDIDSCIIEGGCLFKRFFQGEQGGSVVKVLPYTLTLLDNNPQRIQEGQTFDFSLFLFGGFYRYLPYIIAAFDDAGRYGLGRRLGGGHIPFRLLDVRLDSKSLYRPGLGVVPLSSKDLTEAFLDMSLEPTTPCREVALTFYTPLRMKSKNSFVGALPFTTYVRALLRRLSSLSIAFGTGDLNIDFASYIELSKEVKIGQSDIMWQDLCRYSSRQRKHLKIGGLTGRVVYEGEAIGKFIPFIELGAKFHIGKQSTFGLGKYSYTYY